MTRHEIQILRAVGMAQTAIAATTGVSVRSVRRIEDEPVVRSSDTAALIRARGVGRPSLAAPWAPTVERWLQEDRTVPSGEIIRRLREDHGYRGGKSALYELIRRLRPVPVAPLVRFEGVPGEFSQHDFGMVSVRYVTGVVERVRFFASRLKWSRFVDVTLVPDEREEALIVWNPVFGQVALDYRFAPELCWPRAGQQKGAVENLVGWVKKSFFTCRRFHDRADLERQLTDWLSGVNTERPNRATGIIPAVRLAEEERRLRPLPIAAGAYALKYAVVVSARARVSHAGHEYSMPPATIGQAATLHLYEERVEILTKTGLVIRHPRRAAAASLLPEHRAAMLDAVRGARGRLYFQRQSLWELGRPAEAWLTELIHRRPARWRPDVEDCFALLQHHGAAPLVDAFAWGLEHGAIGAEYVRLQLARLPAVAGA